MADNAYRTLALQLFTTPADAAIATPPRRLFVQSGLSPIPGAGAATLVNTGNITEVVQSQQDGLLFDKMFAQFTAGDADGDLTLTDLTLEILNGATPVDVIATAYPTLLSPRGVNTVNFSVPPLITGADLLFYSETFGGGGIPFPMSNLKLSLSTTWANKDAAAHSIAVAFFARYRKLTGLQED